MNIDDFLSEFQLEAGEKLDIIASQLVQLEHDPTNLQPIRDMFLAAHTIKGGAAMLRLTDVEALAHGVEDLLSGLRDQHRTMDVATADLLFQSIDHLRDAVARAAPDAVGAEPDTGVLSFAGQLRTSASSASSAAEAGLTDGSAGRAPGPRALLVDDSPTVCELYRMLLQDAGFEVEVCGNGQVALARTQAWSFDLVVAGLQNKGIGGFELIAALRANPAYSDVPVVLTSADANPDLSRRAAECGARALVRKGSLRDEQLSEVLRDLGAQRAA